MKVLLAVDGSVYSEKMVGYLVKHPDFIGSSSALTLLTVLPEMSVRSRAALGQEAVDRYYLEDAQAVLQPARERLTPSYPNLETLWRVGAIGKAIAEHAEQGEFDLIVMGSHGQNALASLVMGSVTTRVLARCKIPVLIVR